MSRKTKSIPGACVLFILTKYLCQGRPRAQAGQWPQKLSYVKDTHIDLRHTDGLKQKKSIVGAGGETVFSEATRSPLFSAKGGVQSKISVYVQSSIHKRLCKTSLKKRTCVLSDLRL